VGRFKGSCCFLPFLVPPLLPIQACHPSLPSRADCSESRCEDQVIPIFFPHLDSGSSMSLSAKSLSEGSDFFSHSRAGPSFSGKLR